MNRNFMTKTNLFFISILSLAIYSCGGNDFDCANLEFNIGDFCNDGNAFTFNDTVTTDCRCIGIPVIFDCEAINLNIGDSCDDADQTTLNDVIDADCNCVGTPTIVDSTITYTNTVKAILDSSCATSTACHAASSSSTFPMSTYDATVAAVGLGRILGAINREPGFSAMPRNGDKLDQEKIDAITEWINMGTPE